jgi:hypothetical protein
MTPARRPAQLDGVLISMLGVNRKLQDQAKYPPD